MQDIHGIANKGANSPKHAFPQSPYKHEDFPQVMYRGEETKIVKSREELLSAISDGYSVLPKEEHEEKPQEEPCPSTTPQSIDPAI